LPACEILPLLLPRREAPLFAPAPSERRAGRRRHMQD
jgi:hypothetical protein